jgi:hypothetical protein
MNEYKIFLTRVLSVSLITAIPCAILLALYFVTAPRIAEYHEIKLKRSVLDIFNIPYRTEEKQFFGLKLRKADKKDVRNVFDNSITVEAITSQYNEQTGEGEKDKELFMYYDDDELQGIGFIATRLGYGFNKAADISLFTWRQNDGREIQETICRAKAEAETVNRKRKKNDWL